MPIDIPDARIDGAPVNIVSAVQCEKCKVRSADKSAGAAAVLRLGACVTDNVTAIVEVLVHDSDESAVTLIGGSCARNVDVGDPTVIDVGAAAYPMDGPSRTLGDFATYVVADYAFNG